MFKLFPVKLANCGKKEVTAGLFHTIAIADIHSMKTIHILFLFFVFVFFSHFWNTQVVKP